jgi:hypothetical protein
LKDSEFSAWVKGVDADKLMAYCRLFGSSFSIRNRGVSQPRAHAEKDKHCAHVRAMKDQVVFQTTSSARESGIQEVQLSLSVKTWSLSHEEKVCRAEALWAMKVVSAGFSYQSSDKTSILFQLMFPDSQIAANFSLDSNKCSHIVVFGLGPYFHGEAVRSLKSLKCCFYLELDETSTCSGDKQLDTHLRFWDEVQDMVVVHYYNISPPWLC